MEAITVKGLNFTFKNTDKPILQNINFSVKRGELVLLCGVSGSGKTTLLRHLKKELIPVGKTTGTVSFFQKEIKEMSQAESAGEIGFVFQRPDTQIVTDKVYSELAFGLENLGVPQKEIQRRVAEIASFFGMGSWYYKDNAVLSGGQKQLLNLASVMVMNPKVLILDEPTSQLDPIASEEFLSIIRRLNKEFGITVILSEHRLENLLAIADRVLVLQEGTLLSDTKPRDLYKKAKVFSGTAVELSLPVATRVALEVDKRENELPLTGREGRQWLEAFTQKGVKTRECKREKEKQSETILQVKNLFFRYDKKGEDVLTNVNLTVKKGEILSVVGENGSGKTTLLNCMAGVFSPYNGKIIYERETILKGKGRENYLQKRAVLPQDPTTTFLKDTLEDDLFSIAKDLYSEGEAVKIVEEICEEMGLFALRKSHPYDLSGGETQLLSFAKILLLKPKIVFLDECTKGLDALSKEMLKKRLLHLKEKGITLVSVSHDLEFAAEISDSVAFCFKGQLVGKEDPQEFFSTNRFYTTAASKMSKGIFHKAVTAKDVITLCKENM